MPYDLVLSSGFLAFAEQAGFLAAIEGVGIDVDGICGTSSGALAGALWAAGLPAARILEELTASPPLRTVGLHGRVWRGLFTMEPVVERLRTWLPPTFEELDRPLGVGVVGADGAAVLRTSGSLPDAVAASCAMPGVFAPVNLGDGHFSDGGSADRVFLGPWRAHRGQRPCVAHIVDRTAGRAGEPDLTGVVVVRSPRSGARLWGLGDVGARFERSRSLALDALRAHTS